MPERNHPHASPWFTDRRANMVWHALVLVTVLLPLASLTLDVPRYFTLRARLQLAADAAAQAGAACVDFLHFQNVGETRLLGDCVRRDSARLFSQATQDLQAKGHSPSLGAVAVDEAANTVSVQASGTTTLFFDLTPRLTVHVYALSQVRMDKR